MVVNMFYMQVNIREKKILAKLVVTGSEVTKVLYTVLCIVAI